MSTVATAIAEAPRAPKTLEEAGLSRDLVTQLVLKTLQSGPQHGYGIAVRLQQLSADVLQVEEGSLYPALYRMEQRGWISSSSVPSIKSTPAPSVGRRILASAQAFI